MGTMPFDLAVEITRACVAHCAFPNFAREGEQPPPLPDVSLEEMLIANRIVHEAPLERKQNDDGSTSSTIMVHCAPRLLAACYALQNYGGSPEDLLQAVGCRFKATEDES
jgi:hypothetical protein